MDNKRYPAHELVGKPIVTKEGKAIGEVKDITFESRTGELVQLLLKNTTRHAELLGLEKNEKNFMVPFNSIIAIGDFIVVAEEDIV